jgi:hypothetical protein
MVVRTALIDLLKVIVGGVIERLLAMFKVKERQ